MLKKSCICILIALLAFTVYHQSALAEPHVSADHAILMEQQSGRILFQKRAHQRTRIASITKIMTAILAIESGKMNRKVTISKKAAYTEGSSLYLKEGEKIRLQDLVFGMMLRSGNDAAVAIAEYLGGSVGGFTHLMNEKAALIGMTDTVFANPHGLDDHKKIYSSAYDMARLTQYAMKNEMFRTIFGTKTHRVEGKGPKARSYVWKNKNKLLERYPHTTGGKTGFTTVAKRTLVSTAKKDDLKLIAVTLNDPDDWQDHAGLYDWGFDHFHLRRIVDKGQVNGIDNEFYKGNVYTKQGLKYPLSGEEEEDLSTVVNLYQPPSEGEWKHNQVPTPVGKMFVKLKGESIGKLPLYFKKEQPEEKGQSFWDLFKDIFLITSGVHRHG